VITKQKEQEEELRISEERYRDIVQNTSDLIQSVTANGKLLFVNDTWLSKLGYTKEYVLGKNIFSFIHPKSKKTCELILKGLKNQETFQSTEISFITKDGKEVICEGNISAVYKNNKMLHTTSMLRDITEIKRNRHELEEKRNLLLNAEKMAKVGSWYLDFKSNKAFWSKGLYNIFGIKEGTEMSFEKFISHVHDDDKDFVSETWFNTLKGEKHYIEFRIKSKLPEKWVRSIIKMEFDDLKNPRTAIGFIQDITESKSNLKKLELQQQQLKNAQKIANMGSWIYDVVNDKLEWSNETYHIFEIPLNSPMNLDKFIDKVHPEDRKFVTDAWNAALTGKKYDIEHRIIVNGQEKWVREKAKVEFDINRRPLTGIGIVHDITEMKKNELRLVESEMQLNDAQKIGKIGSYVWNTETDEITGSRELYEILEIKDKGDVFSFSEQFSHVSQNDKPALIRKIEISKEQRSSFTHQFQYITLSGKVKYLEVRKTADSMKQNPVLFIGTLQDITDIKMLEKNLFNSIIETEEKERERISIELHDGVCQQLSGSVMLLKMGIKSLEANDKKGINLIK
ncbi:MAG: PAS domain S-box protein, partial [Bacteroidota bacterium]|nr:PAS domain S-box protein [Bacteroidota bacterium]